MKRILISGNDHTRDILPGNEEAAPQGSPAAALSLTAHDEAEYLSKLLARLRTESGLHTSHLNLATRPGFLGLLQGFVRRFLWKLLRYQHDPIAFQQTAINAQSAAAMEFMRTEYRRDLETLTARLNALESRMPPPPPAS